MCLHETQDYRKVQRTIAEWGRGRETKINGSGMKGKYETAAQICIAHHLTRSRKSDNISKTAIWSDCLRLNIKPTHINYFSMHYTVSYNPINRGKRLTLFYKKNKINKKQQETISLAVRIVKT